MKFKKTLSVAVGVILLSAAGYMYADGRTTISEIEAMSVTHKSLDELENRSELIVSGEPIASENHFITDEEGFVEEGFTITSFKIDSIYANKSNKTLNSGEIIKVSEPVYTVDNGIKPGKTQFTIEGYELMKKSGRYLLVLRPDLTYPDLYVIVGVNEGKYRLDVSEKSVAGTGKFKNELISKYNIR
ncbi:hypothetical protein ABEV74_09790 [Paenibacillus cisolokensis]|uniref:hypothetical protein n=1 Tax=Paenibacillus cisolokensis TaxID=1658519 RepID=UPI003D2CC793